MINAEVAKANTEVGLGQTEFVQFVTHFGYSGIVCRGFSAISRVEFRLYNFIYFA